MNDELRQYFDLPAVSNLEEQEQAIIDKINLLIKMDMQKLVFILYRVDVNEKKMRVALEENSGTDAAKLIYQLIIEREEEKLISRKKNTPPFPASSAEEEW